MSNKDVRYPRQLYTAKREQIVFGIDNYLSAPSEKDTVPPLEMHSPFSRFVATIIDKSGNKIITPKANIPANDIPGIVSIATAAMAERIRSSNSDTGIEASSDVSPAYTQIIPFGRFKNRSPATVLLDNPTDREELLKTKEFFQSKVSEWPQNQKHIDAIDAAITLMDSGTLKQNSAAQVKAGMQVIYSVNHKYMADTNPQGHRLFYGMTIECYYNNKYPWVVTIENFFAPGQQTSKGGLTPKIDEKSGYAKGIIRLNDMEWSRMLNRLKSDIRNFESMWYSHMFKEAMEIDTAHREARKAPDVAAVA